MEGACSTHGKIRNTYENLVGKPEGKRQLGRNRIKWKDNIGMDLREIMWESVDWIHLAEDRDKWRALFNTIINVCVP
jgi:hypothetical protein